jgi:hypothetical protein
LAWIQSGNPVFPDVVCLGGFSRHEHALPITIVRCVDLNRGAIEREPVLIDNGSAHHAAGHKLEIHRDHAAGRHRNRRAWSVEYLLAVLLSEKTFRGGRNPVDARLKARERKLSAVIALNGPAKTTAAAAATAIATAAPAASTVDRGRRAVWRGLCLCPRRASRRSARGPAGSTACCAPPACRRRGGVQRSKIIQRLRAAGGVISASIFFVEAPRRDGGALDGNTDADLNHISGNGSAILGGGGDCREPSLARRTPTTTLLRGRGKLPGHDPAGGKGQQSASKDGFRVWSHDTLFLVP